MTDENTTGGDQPAALNETDAAKTGADNPGASVTTAKDLLALGRPKDEVVAWLARQCPESFASEAEAEKALA